MKKNKITYFPYLGEPGGIALCKEHEEKYIKEKVFPLLDIFMKSLSGNIPCKFCVE